MATKENVLTRTDDFIKWFLPKIEKFPRNYKFLFGDRLVEIQLDVLENLIEAYYRKEKLANLCSLPVPRRRSRSRRAPKLERRRWERRPRVSQRC